MTFPKELAAVLSEEGVERSTMMKAPCLRYKGKFLAMVFDKEDALIVKLSPERVNELIAQGTGREFNFTKKRFKEWLLIDRKFSCDYEARLREALAYAKQKG